MIDMYILSNIHNSKQSESPEILSPSSASTYFKADRKTDMSLLFSLCILSRRFNGLPKGTCQAETKMTSFLV